MSCLDLNEAYRKCKDEEWLATFNVRRAKVERATHK